MTILLQPSGNSAMHGMPRELAFGIMNFYIYSAPFGLVYVTIISRARANLYSELYLNALS